MKAIGLPLMTTNESSLPGDGTSSLFGLHQPKVIIQIPQHSSVSTLSHAQARQGLFINNVISNILLCLYLLCVKNILK